MLNINKIALKFFLIFNYFLHLFYQKIAEDILASVQFEDLW